MPVDRSVSRTAIVLSAIQRSATVLILPTVLAAITAGLFSNDALGSTTSMWLLLSAFALVCVRTLSASVLADITERTAVDLIDLTINECASCRGTHPQIG